MRSTTSATRRGSAERSGWTVTTASAWSPLPVLIVSTAVPSRSEQAASMSACSPLP